MSAADPETEKTRPLISFEAWCERHSVDPDEVADVARYLRIDVPTLKRLPIDDPAWLTKLKQTADDLRARRTAWSGHWAQQNIGPDPFRRLSGPEILKVLPPQLRQLTLRYRPTLGALIVGPTGTCKSMTACFLMRRALFEAMQGSERWHSEVDAKHGGGEQLIDDEDRRAFASDRYGVLWTTASGLARARRGHRLGDGEPKLVAHAMRAKLLAIDDIGWEPAHDTVVTDVMAERYDRGLPTVATSGERPAALSQRYGAALIRRIIETEGRKGLLVDMFDSAPVALAA